MNSELNADIARLMGWTDIRPRLADDGLFGVLPGLKGSAVVPDYSGDPAAALGLLEHVLSLPFEGGKIIVNRMEQGCDAWYIELAVLWHNHTIQSIGATGESPVFARAIARACLDALRALAGDGDGAAVAEAANEDEVGR